MDENILELTRYLKKKIGSKIEFHASIFQDQINGAYFSDGEDIHYNFYDGGLSFYCKFCKEKFLRIGIGSFCTNDNSVGEKLAALSSFYEVLSEQYGEPTVFYTIKDDYKGNLSLQWSFVNKEEDIQKFKNGSYFDDAEIDELIVIGETRTQTSSYQLSDTTRKLNAKQIGVPFELISLVDENIEDFVKYKTGKEIVIPEGAKIDGVPVTSLKKKLSLERTKK